MSVVVQQQAQNQADGREMHLVWLAVAAVCTGGGGCAFLPAGICVTCFSCTTSICRPLRAVLLLLPLLQLC